MAWELQKSVTIKGEQFNITNDGDFRMVLDCFSALQDEDLSEDLRVLASLLIFYTNFHCIADVVAREDIYEDLINEMYKFFNCGSVESVGVVRKHNVVDWDTDSQILCSAINNVANTEVRALPFLHWWTFMGYYMAVGESVFATVVSIRDKLASGKKLEKYEQDFRRDNPNYFTKREDKKALEEVLKIWNKS